MHVASHWSTEVKGKTRFRSHCTHVAFAWAMLPPICPHFSGAVIGRSLCLLGGLCGAVFGSAYPKWHGLLNPYGFAPADSPIGPTGLTNSCNAWGTMAANRPPCLELTQQIRLDLRPGMGLHAMFLAGMAPQKGAFGGQTTARDGNAATISSRSGMDWQEQWRGAANVSHLSARRALSIRQPGWGTWLLLPSIHCRGYLGHREWLLAVGGPPFAFTCPKLGRRSVFSSSTPIERGMQALALDNRPSCVP